MDPNRRDVLAPGGASAAALTVGGAEAAPATAQAGTTSAQEIQRFCVLMGVAEYGDPSRKLRMLGSTQASPSPCPVGDYPTDTSVYGVRGVNGNVRDWCANVWSFAGPGVVDERVQPDVAADDDPTLRVLRGGCWSASPWRCRLAGRTVNEPGGCFASLGFRLLRPLP